MGSFDYLDRLCRLCGAESQDLIHLFGNQTGERNLVSIIKKYAKVTVNVCDALPHQICGPCIAKLDEVVDFVDNSLATQTKFKNLLEAVNASTNKVQVSKNCYYEFVKDVKVVVQESEDDVDDDDPSNDDSTSCLYKKRAVKTLVVKSGKKAAQGCIGKLKAEDLKGSSLCNSELGDLNAEDVDPSDIIILQEEDESEEGIEVENSSTGIRLSRTRKGGVRKAESSNERLDESEEGIEVENRSTGISISRTRKGGVRKAESSNERLEGKSKCLVRCCFCEAPFHGLEKLKTHVFEVHKSKEAKFRCPQCPESFLKITSMTSHQKRKHQDLLQSCPKCKKLYPVHYLWTRHMLVHTNTRPFTCDECDKKFKSKPELYNHKRTHIPRGERYTHCCELCGKRFTQKANLESHLRLHTGRRPFSCEFCKKSFSQRGNMEEHRRIHTGETPFVCDICGMKYRRQGQLAVHQKRHKGEKPHKCRFCDKQFLRKQVLRTHEHVHTDTRPYKCSFCEKSFRDQGKRKVHERLHTGERPYICQHCNRGFCESGNLKKHLRVHTNYNMKYSNSKSGAVQGEPEPQDDVVATTSSTTVVCNSSSHGINAGSGHFTSECVTPSQILIVPESLIFTSEGTHLSSDTIETTDSAVPLQIAEPVAGNSLIAHSAIDERNRGSGDREEEYRVTSAVPLQSVTWLYQT